MSRFRSFLYIDHAAVESLLSGVEGGTYESEDQRDTSGTGWDAHGNVNAGPVGVSGGGGSTGEHERMRSMRQNAEARFTRLAREIEADEDEQVVEANRSSTNPWTEADEGTFVKFTGDLSVSDIVIALANSQEYSKIGEAFQRAGVFDVTQEQREMLEGLASINEAIGHNLPVVMETHPDHPKTVLNLDPEMSRQRIDRYRGRATVVGRVSEKVPARTRHALVEIPGSRQMNRKERRSKGTNAAQDYEIEGPALILSVLAVYQ
ncbi:DUF6414 family protein [Actinomycetospora cinnamomea]|nr:hypothetical protein [Actinomycetospora cinnamomea]